MVKLHDDFGYDKKNKPTCKTYLCKNCNKNISIRNRKKPKYNYRKNSRNRAYLALIHNNVKKDKTFDMDEMLGIDITIAIEWLNFQGQFQDYKYGDKNIQVEHMYPFMGDIKWGTQQELLDSDITKWYNTQLMNKTDNLKKGTVMPTTDEINEQQRALDLFCEWRYISRVSLSHLINQSN